MAAVSSHLTARHVHRRPRTPAISRRTHRCAEGPSQGRAAPPWCSVFSLLVAIFTRCHHHARPCRSIGLGSAVNLRRQGSCSARTRREPTKLEPHLTIPRPLSPSPRYSAGEVFYRDTTTSYCLLSIVSGREIFFLARSPSLNILGTSPYTSITQPKPARSSASKFHPVSPTRCATRFESSRFPRAHPPSTHLLPQETQRPSPNSENSPLQLNPNPKDVFCTSAPDSCFSLCRGCSARRCTSSGSTSRPHGRVTQTNRHGRLSTLSRGEDGHLG